MRTALLLTCLSLLVLLGCSSETAPLDPAAQCGVSWMSDDGILRYETAEGKVVRGHANPDGSVVFWIEHEGDQFGFELGETHLYEWALAGGERHDLRIEYDDGTGRVEYVANGRRASYRKGDVPRFAMAKADRRPFFHDEMELDLSKHGVYDNPLGEELVAILERLDEELQGSERWFDENGNCSGAFRTLLAGCTAWKCTIGGGAANPLCHACIGSSIGCMILAAVWLGGGR